MSDFPGVPSVPTDPFLTAACAIVTLLHRVAEALEERNRIEVMGRRATLEQSERMVKTSEAMVEKIVPSLCPECGLTGEHLPGCERAF